MSLVHTIRQRVNYWGRAPVTSLHESRPQAVAALAEYVKKNWDTEIGDEVPPTRATWSSDISMRSPKLSI